MRTKTIAILLGFTMAALAQQPTLIGSHRIGESVQEWLAAEHMDLNSICDPANQPKKIKKGVETDCQKLSKVRDSGQGHFRTERPEGVNATTGRPRAQSIDWYFDQGRVDQVRMPRSTGLNSTAQEELNYLTDAYGKPDFVNHVPYQNSYGAQYSYVEAKWTMLDGTEILAKERPNNTGIGSFNFFDVTFLSRERVQQLNAVDAVKRSNNPYSK
jgi:hypothetical protein